jgi:putative alpha-1,2-mannosidase
MVPFDTDGLSQAMTRPVLLGRLEQFFTRSACSGRSPFLPNPYYWPANEPDLFAGWIFGALGDGTRAGRWLRWTTVTHYTDKAGGLPGNDDSGTMSAFYIFASLGFYPIPGSDKWVLGSPLFPKATLGPVTIDAPNASKKVRYVQSITRNGQPAGPVLRQADLAGSTLHFDLK